MQFKQNSTHLQQRIRYRKCGGFFTRVSTGLFFSPSPSFSAAMFSLDAAAGTRCRQQIWLMGERAMWSREAGDRVSAGAQGSPQRHQRESTPHGVPWVRTATAHLPGGPCNTATLLGLTSAWTKQEKEATSLTGKRGKQHTKTFCHPQTSPPFFYRLPSHTQLW